MKDDEKEKKGQNRELAPELRANLWKPGQSGNPGGRPKGLAHLIRKSTKDGKLIVSQVVKILLGQKIKGAWGSPAYKDILEAAKWLAERGFGRTELMLSDNVNDYDLRAILYMELSKHSDTPREIRHISEGALEGQAVETEQPVQHPDQGEGNSEVSDK